MSTNPSFPEKPGPVTAISILTLVSGIFNILLALIWTAGVAIFTLGIGLLCSPLLILPAILGVFEIIYAAQLMVSPPRPMKPSMTIAILEIICILEGNVVALVAGVLALVFYNEPVVKNYFAQINSNRVI
jgi:hypothetical protein